MNILPRTRDFEIVVQESKDEIFIYDLTCHKAHCLNSTTALVWQNCDGEKTVSEIAKKAKLPDEYVSFALDELQKADLLAEKSDWNVPADGLSRRKMLIKVGATAASLPLITSLVAPQAIHAQSGACLEPCGTFELNPTPFFADIQSCVDALFATAQTACCSGVLNPQGGFAFGTSPELCRGYCGTIQGSCIMV